MNSENNTPYHQTPYNYATNPRWYKGCWMIDGKLVTSRLIYPVYIQGEETRDICFTVEEAKRMAEGLNERHNRIANLSISQDYQPVRI